MVAQLAKALDAGTSSGSSRITTMGVRGRGRLHYFPDGSYWQTLVVPAYTYQPEPFQWEDFTGTNLELGINTHQTVTLPFPIVLGGIRHTYVDVDSNGRLSFGDPGSDSNPVPFPNPAQEYINNVAPFWDRFAPIPNTNQEVWTGVGGSAPNRESVVEWYNVPRAGGCTDPNATVTFQAVFYENSESFRFNYAIPRSVEHRRVRSATTAARPRWARR